METFNICAGNPKNQYSVFPHLPTPGNKQNNHTEFIFSYLGGKNPNQYQERILVTRRLLSNQLACSLAMSPAKSFGRRHHFCHYWKYILTQRSCFIKTTRFCNLADPTINWSLQLLFSGSSSMLCCMIASQLVLKAFVGWAEASHHYDVHMPQWGIWREVFLLLLWLYSRFALLSIVVKYYSLNGVFCFACLH